MFVIFRLPLKRALTGPTLTATSALNASSPVFSSDSQPAMHDFSTSGSLSAAQVVSTDAGISRSPFSSMATRSVGVEGRLRSRGTQRTTEIGEAGQIVHGQEAIDMRQQRPHPGRARLEAVEAQQRIEPDDAVRMTAQLGRGAAEVAVLVAIEAVGDEQQRRVRAEQPARPIAVEFIEARRDPRAALPVRYQCIGLLQRDVGI